jgi:hypothetical protein
LAALGNDRGQATDRVPGWIHDAEASAKALGVTMVAVPERPATVDKSELASKTVLNYLFHELQPVARELAERHGADHAALFVLAVNSTSLIVIYQPGSPAAETIAGAIAAAGARAEIPSELWQPLSERIENKAPPAEVQKAVREMYMAIDQHLAKSAEP